MQEVELGFVLCYDEPPRTLELGLFQQTQCLLFPLEAGGSKCQPARRGV